MFCSGNPRKILERKNHTMFGNQLSNLRPINVGHMEDCRVKLELRERSSDNHDQRWIIRRILYGAIWKSLTRKFKDLLKGKQYR